MQFLFQEKYFQCETIFLKRIIHKESFRDFLFHHQTSGTSILLTLTAGLGLTPQKLIDQIDL